MNRWYEKELQEWGYKEKPPEKKHFTGTKNLLTLFQYPQCTGLIQN